MPIEFQNEYSKQWLARKGPAKVFGKDVDRRERLSDEEAIEWFDGIWASNLRDAIQRASGCDIDFVRSKVPHYAQNFIDEEATHREFTFANCLFVCQLADLQTCDQLWFIPSTSGDPRTLYVKFETVPIKEAFDNIAKEHGWEEPDKLAEKILLDFMESVTRREFRKQQQDEFGDL